MANPQKENGFTSIANEILDEIPTRKFNGTQLKIITLVWRYTYGFHRKSHDFSLNFIVEKTGLSKDSVKKELKNLTSKNVLAVVQEASFNQPRKLAFNKNYDQWKFEKNLQGDKRNTGLQLSPSTGGEKSHPTGVQTSPPTGGQLSPQLNISFKENIKDISKEINEDERASKNSIVKLLLENNIIAPTNITSTLTEDINDIYSDFEFDDPFTMIANAIKDAVRGNGRTWKFVYNKLHYWRKQGFKNVQAIQEFEDRSQSKQGGRVRNDKREAPMPKWAKGEQIVEEKPPEEVEKRAKELEAFLNNL